MDLLSRLEAIEDIKRLKAQYFRFVDLKDWASLKTVFAPDVEFDRSAAASVFNFITEEWEHSRPSDPMIVKGRETIMAMVKKAVEGLMTVHHGHMPEIEILSEASAKAIWPMTDQLRDRQGKIVLRGAGHYHEEYEKLNSRWMIKKIKLTRIYLDSEQNTQRIR